MAAPAPPTSTSRSTTAEGGGRGHIGLVVLGSIASGLVLGVHTARTRIEQVHGSAAAMGARSRGRVADRRACLAGLLAGRPYPQTRRMGVARAPSAPGRLVIPWRTPVAPQLVTPRAALPGPPRPAASCGR